MEGLCGYCNDSLPESGPNTGRLMMQTFVYNEGQFVDILGEKKIKGKEDPLSVPLLGGLWLKRT